ncbi:dicarboxylate/amino acid:cation symporter [Fretibacterium sp. OH1220_COT-178]|uniref:dicarboxylate/amino acid:cation symporter n=1 Tax=Fretibacterium sp. OH1220_COT-178 TaxID=2491047 RepID=UPI000F5DF3FA|nr:dicarboxylate/amino acid:cation symporter [Fretibacterium sp. OH1220_COT-178]RRD65407.1 dicarboxylate/amino acid:cation symporter [Fretibacterium sp. OH1220_COT-178]
MTETSATPKKFKISLTHSILLATVLGMVTGYIVGPSIAPIKIFGDIFLRLIQMSVPLIILGAVLEAVGQINPKELGKLGFKMFAWFGISTVLAAVVGLGLAFAIQPGVGLPPMETANPVQPPTQTITQVILNFFPVNIVDSMAKGSMIQVIVFAIVLGVAVSLNVRDDGDRSLLNGLRVFNRSLLTMIKVIMRTAPLGVFSLMAWVSGSLGFDIILPLAKYLGGIALGVVLIMVVMIAVTAVYVGVNPFKLAAKLSEMTLVAATTTSSAISLPVKMQDSENKLGVSKKISNLVNPLGMVLNSAGQALFLSMGSIMIAQFFHIDMPLSRAIQVVAISTLACMGTLAVPGGALIILASLMPTLGLPAEGIAILASVDWFRGMITTIPNVDCDALIALIIAKGEGEFNRDIFDGKVDPTRTAA